MLKPGHRRILKEEFKRDFKIAPVGPQSRMNLTSGTPNHPKFTMDFIHQQLGYEVLITPSNVYVYYYNREGFGLIIGRTVGHMIHEYTWERSQFGIDKNHPAEYQFWQAYIPLLFLADPINGSHTFSKDQREEFNNMAKMLNIITLGRTISVSHDKFNGVKLDFAVKNRVWYISASEEAHASPLTSADYSFFTTSHIRWIVGNVLTQTA